MEIEHALGADVIMAFDQLPPGQAPREVAFEAHERTLRWLERCRTRFAELRARDDAPRQTLFPIVQGGVYADLRRDSIRRILEIGDWDGIGIGGLSVGEPKPAMYEMLDVLEPEMPKNLPRYLMGVGYPDDLLEDPPRRRPLRLRGADAERQERHGVDRGRGAGQHQAGRFGSTGPLDPACDCVPYLHARHLRHLFVAGEALVLRLLSLHNLRFLIRLAERARTAILEGTFEGWSEDWLARYRRARTAT